MTANQEAVYFLGANTPAGFHSLYGEMLPPEEARAIYILKGGPGCGKSTLMKQVRSRALEAGLRVESIVCSGDPDSLDALILPQARIALCDGTAPHVMEAKYPGVTEHYVNLESCYDPEGLYPIRSDIFACKGRCQACYRRAYRCLEASASLEEDGRTLLLTRSLTERMIKRAEGILTRELPPIKGSLPGRVTQRFLSSPTHRGMAFLYDTAAVQCRKIYQLADSYGLGHELLIHLLTGAVERGYHPIACPDPMAPERLSHVLVPDGDVAFLTSPTPLPEKPYRRIRLDAMTDRAILNRSRSRLRFSRRVSAALFGEATASFADAKAAHDELEALYHPHVDFARVEELGQAVSDEIFTLI